MKFKIIDRDGFARIGKLFLDKEIVTPNISYLKSSRIKLPEFSELTCSNEKTQKKSNFNFEKILALDEKHPFVYPKDVPKELHLKTLKKREKLDENFSLIPANKDIIDDISNIKSKIFIVYNAFQLFNQPTKFADFIVKLRVKIGYDKLIYLPVVGEPSNFSVLTYMGIDLFDSLTAAVAARNEYLLFPTGKVKTSQLKENFCNCPSCLNTKEPSEMSFEEILNHNYYSINSELKLVRNAIYERKLRHLVETRVRVSPLLASILKNLDNNYYNFFEKTTPVTKKIQLLSTSNDSLNRPEIIRFQKRAIDRYIKPDSAKILLLLPCSAKKPYSFSKTHKFFKEKLQYLQNSNVVHEMIITSPIGIVPRELELTYPASNYDTILTGIWYENEKKMIRTLLEKYLAENKYDKIIVHLPKNIQEFILDLLDSYIITCKESPISKTSLDRLYKTLQKEVEPYEKISNKQRQYENILALAAYQFGKKPAKSLLKNTQIRGKYPFFKIFEKENQLAMLTKDRGLLSLTLNGAKKIQKSNEYFVEIDDDFELKGSVFAPGVKLADSKIRIGDEVIIISNKKLCGVGVAKMSGEEMVQLNYGEAVSTRHKV